jgi:WD40 repeat protein
MQINFTDYGEEVTPLEVLEIGTPTVLGFSEPENRVIAGYDALQSASEDQFHTVINFCGGIMALAIGYVQPGDMPTFEPTFTAMLDTIQYGDGEPVSCRSAFADLALITPTNAAQVSQLTTYGDETVPVESVAFNPDGSVLAAGMLDGNAYLWSMVTNTELQVLDGNREGAKSVAFGAGGYQVVTGTGNGRVWMWDPATGESSGRLQDHEGAVESVAFVPDGFLIASGGGDGSVRLYDMLQGSERAPLAEESETPVMSVAFNTDGSLLAAGGGNTIWLWDAEAGTIEAELETEISDISSVAFSPDGAMLVYGGADPAAWVWDLADDNHVLLEGHDGQVFALAFSPDGSMIISGDASGVRLWDATTGENLIALASASGGAVNSVAFSPTGTLIAAGGEAGGVVLWGTSADGGAAAETAASESTGAENTASENTGETTETTTTTDETATGAATCTITAPNNANLRGGPGTEFGVAGSLSAGQSAEVDGQAQGADGMTWYRLTDGAWVRSDVVGAPSECEGVPVVTP